MNSLRRIRSLSRDLNREKFMGQKAAQGPVTAFNEPSFLEVRAGDESCKASSTRRSG